MQAGTILVATDFSPSSRKALDWATALGQATGAKLLIVTVEPGQPTSNFGSIYQGLADPGIAELAKRLAELVPCEGGVRCEHRILRGEPASEILKLAEEEKVDAVVMGSHGHKGLRHALLGSTAEAVLHKARCPVMICKC